MNTPISIMLPIPTIILQLPVCNQNYQINISYPAFAENNQFQINDIKEEKPYINEDNMIIKDEMTDVKEETGDMIDNMFEVKDELNIYYAEPNEKNLHEDPYFYLNAISPISSVSSNEYDDDTIDDLFASEEEYDYMNGLNSCFNDIHEIMQYLKEDKKCFGDICELV